MPSAHRLSPDASTPVAHPAPAPGAGLLPRFASLIYEGFLLVPVLFLAAYLFLALTREAQTPVMHLLFQTWLFAVVGAYFCYCWVKSGQTLAMKTWRLRVEGRDGAPLRLRQAMLRYALSALGLFGVGLGFLWAFVDRDRLFLHDRIAGTRIVKVLPDGAPVSDAPGDTEARSPGSGTGS